MKQKEKRCNKHKRKSLHQQSQPLITLMPQIHVQLKRAHQLLMLRCGARGASTFHSRARIYIGLPSDTLFFRCRFWQRTDTDGLGFSSVLIRVLPMQLFTTDGHGRPRLYSVLIRVRPMQLYSVLIHVRPMQLLATDGPFD